MTCAFCNRVRRLFRVPRFVHRKPIPTPRDLMPLDLSKGTVSGLGSHPGTPTPSKSHGRPSVAIRSWPHRYK
jgi:hypothetical protein